MKKEMRHSYGVIPLRKGSKGDVEVLLINQKDRFHPDADYWTFPKGTPEAGESGLETAIRETREEVGIACDEIDTDFLYEEHFTFIDGDTEFEKTVTYYIGRVEVGEVVIQEKEVADFAWLSFDAAKEKLTYDGTKKIIDAIAAHLSNSRLFAEK